MSIATLLLVAKIAGIMTVMLTLPVLAAMQLARGPTAGRSIATRRA